MKLTKSLEYSQTHFDESRWDDIHVPATTHQALPPGHYAYAQASHESVLLARDPLGCNKLFYGFKDPEELVVTNRILRALELGVPLQGLASCPAGHILRMTEDELCVEHKYDLSRIKSDDDFSLDDFQTRIQRKLVEAFKAVSSAYSGYRFVVCLSGGLDSSIVATMALKHLAAPIAVSFTYLDDADVSKVRNGSTPGELESASDDFRCAEVVADALSMPLHPVIRTRQSVGEVVATTVRLAQDWRDFNVHCAIVNLFLAQDIRAMFPNENVVVLTGDLMNEFVCDYQEEVVESTTYYRLPRVDLEQRRKYLVKGLDAGDREIGVFSEFGLTVCQPFAALAEDYMRVPASFLESSNSKLLLNGFLLPPNVISMVNLTKTRAQVGGKDKGTLGICHRLGIDQQMLYEIWKSHFPAADADACGELIQLGRYRTSLQRPDI